MTAKAMLDTNILVYAYDRSEEKKQKAALRLLETLIGSGAGVVCTQVLAEFFVTVTRKITEPLTVEQASGRIKSFCQLWPVLEINEMIVCEAIRGVKEHHFSYWDAQIWASARLNQIGMILSEDYAHNSLVEGVRFINPLLPDFDLKYITG
jgi:predicted nucleic acid-binding protein